MDEVLQRFFKSIDFVDETNSFNKSTIEKVTLNKMSDTFDVIIINEKPVNIEAVYALLEAAKKGINGENKVNVKFKNNAIDMSDILKYFLFLLSRVIDKRPSLGGLSEDDFTIVDEIINIEVSSKIEMTELKKETKSIIEIMDNLGIPNLEVNIEINKEKEAKVKEDLLEKPEVQNIEKAKPVFFGRHVSGEITAIDSILSEGKNIIVEVYVFGIDTLERENINIVTLKVSDKTDSIIAKIFKRDKDEFKEIMSHLHTGNWYRIHGNVEFDNFAKDLVLSIRDMEKIPSKDLEVVDDAKEKRVELHLHTFMSTMDSVVNHEKVVKFVHGLGHRAVAITDHNVLQAFPDIYKSVKKINADIEQEDEKFKVLYGAELSVVNDDVDVVFNLKDYNLLQDEYVVFDTETTGFRAGSDTMIEIGAVKVRNGETLDRFSELINPGCKIPKKITEITNITDAMVKGKDNEENVLKRFLEWVGNAPMVAHNAKFDISFLKAAIGKYELGEFNNTVIDTMSLARMLNPEWPNHKLQTLAKKYNIGWNEDHHHRADYDAEGTAACYTKMAKILYDRNIETTKELYDSIDKEELIKFSYPFHATLIVKNQIGLKNLFKIISLANTKYLFKNDQPKIPRHEIEKYREGLLIGSGCINGEVFENVLTMDDEEISGLMRFYDYIEVQPISAMTHLLQAEGANISFRSEIELQNHLSKIINMAKTSGKIVCATGDVHNLITEDNKYREIIVHQKTNGRYHPLNRRGLTLPNMKFLTTNEMLEQFSFLDEDLAKEIVIDNTNKIADMVEHIEIIKKDLYTPKIENSDEDTKEMVFNRAHELYGDPLPPIVVERIDKELTGIIENGYSVLYLISQKLVKKSNDDGYFVGSRGTVGSSFVATMMGITEVNPLPAHYLCRDCKIAIFEDEEGMFSDRYPSGYDMEDRVCVCGSKMIKDGQDIPFSSFLGYEAEKVPDIDLNFSGDYQSKSHDYTKELFGEKYVFRAGTIGTVAHKTAFGYVKGYLEDKGILLRNIEVERLAAGCTGVKRTTGQHPGGIIVIPDYMDVSDFTAYQYPADEPNSTWYTTHFAFSAIHDNVLKLDILGHDDPTMLKHLEDSTGVDILSIPFDDEKVLSLFTSPKALGVSGKDINWSTGTLGIPEFGTGFANRMLEETKPKIFADLIKISGLAHGTGIWAGNGQELMKNGIPFADIIGCREELITTLIKYGMDGATAFKITEFIRKSYAPRVSKLKNAKWLALKPELEKITDALPEWFIESIETIEYMFPKAHATAYVMMAFRVAWFKVYRPLHYYSAFFGVRAREFDVEAMIGGENAIKNKIADITSKGYDATNKEEAIANTLALALEMTLRGYKFKNIDITLSEARNFVIDEEEKALILPFRALDGLGDSVANKIIEERKIRPFMSIEDVQIRGKINSTTIEKMKTLGIFKGLPETSQLSLFEMV